MKRKAFRFLSLRRDYLALKATYLRCLYPFEVMVRVLYAHEEKWCSKESG